MNESEAELLRWKADALQLLAGWDAVFEMIPKQDSDLGRLKHDVVADEIVRLRAERDSARTQYRHLSDQIISRWSDLATEEWAEVERLRAEVNRLRSRITRLEVAGDALTEAARHPLRDGARDAFDAWGEARHER